MTHKGLLQARVLLWRCAQGEHKVLHPQHLCKAPQPLDRQQGHHSSLER